MSESSLKLELNDSYIVDYAYTGSTGKSASSSSSNTKVSKISSKGKIVAVAAGSATITDLKKGKTYKYMVRAYVKAGSKKYYGEYSNVFSVKTK